MKRIERLRRDALGHCKFRGHKMKPFSRKYRHWWYSECRDCGMVVGIDDTPHPGAIEISGDAATFTCGG